MMLRAHGLLDDSQMLDFIRMAASQGPNGFNIMSQYEKMLIDYEDDEDEEDDEQEFDEAELAQIAQIRALAMQAKQQHAEEDEEDDYADEEEDEEEEELNDEAATRMMMMMDEQEKLYLHQQMLEREYLKASTASVLAKGKQPPAINGKVPIIEESKVPPQNGLIGEMIQNPAGLPLGLAEIDDELGEEILAGGNQADDAVDESAYKKLMLQSGYPGGSQINDDIAVKTWIQWYLIQEDHDFMVEVERDFIGDKFNLIKLRE